LDFAGSPRARRGTVGTTVGRSDIQLYIAVPVEQ
jgi:hypothetical protein